MKSTKYMKYGRVIWRYGVELIAETVIYFPIFIIFVLLSSGISELIFIYFSYIGSYTDEIDSFIMRPQYLVGIHLFPAILLSFSIIIRLPWQMIFAWIWRFYLLGQGKNFFGATLIPIVVTYVPCCALFFYLIIKVGGMPFSISNLPFYIFIIISPSFCAAILAPWVVNKITQKNLEDIWLESEAEL